MEVVVVVGIYGGSALLEDRFVYVWWTSFAAAMVEHAMKLLVGYPSMEAFTAPLIIHSAT